MFVWYTGFVEHDMWQILQEYLLARQLLFARSMASINLGQRYVCFKGIT
jgi:hypothetical protein